MSIDTVRKGLRQSITDILELVHREVRSSADRRFRSSHLTSASTIIGFFVNSTSRISISMAKLIFNRTLFEENQADRWKFLDVLDPGKDDSAGFLINSPVPVLTLTSLYIVFVCFIGPLYMRNREPYQLKTVIRFYNLLMVFLAAVLLMRLYDAVESLSAMFDPAKIFDLNDNSGTKVYRMANFILLVRLGEYLDTIFFTLRKKQNQVTFLHVFHHAFVPIYAFWILRTAPLRFNVFIILINSAIHVLMYFYYFLATYQVREEPGAPKKKKLGLIMFIVMKLLMFKKYMTQLQILQFVSLAFYAIYGMISRSNAGITWTYIIANLALAFGFLGLFVHFYLSVYTRKPSPNRVTNKRD